MGCSQPIFHAVSGSHGKADGYVRGRAWFLVLGVLTTGHFRPPIHGKADGYARGCGAVCSFSSRAGVYPKKAQSLSPN
jgi:hypothetical protein